MKKGTIRHSIAKTLILSALLLFSCSQFAVAQEDNGDQSKKSEQSSQEKPKSGDQEKSKSGDKEKSSSGDEASAAADMKGDPKVGKDLFNTNCASCHKRYQRMTGPELHGVTEKYDREWLYEWIHNSQEMIKSGDEQAVKIYEEYNQTVMTAFPGLSEKQIDDILAYVEQPKPEPQANVAGKGGGGTSTGGGGVSTSVILGILIFVLALLVIILVLVNKTLNNFAQQSGLETPKPKPKGKPVWKVVVENQFVMILISIFFLLGSAYFAYGFMMQVGVDQGYAPVQPIHYSHRIHAGTNAIQCKYCHSSARVSKHSGIPSLNVCMNCHMQIQEVSKETGAASEEYSKEFYDGEIQKLYDAVGWDPSMQDYTGETKPVKWVRIHNLPDFAYFNHSQHVTVGGIACQKCHGPVAEYEVMKQYAPLTMGWCIDCHRETKVKMDGNGYYKKIHDQLSKKYGVEELTAAQMGALECGKCHY
jgi:mono/diheme cytochrome c family protein